MRLPDLAGATRVVTVIALASAAAGSHAASDGLMLEEIVVTATKRSESLQDVPISIGVVTGDFIEQFEIEDLRDIQSYVPNLTVQHTFGNWAVRMRGLGSGVTNLAFDSSVSIFNDGVYCGRSRCLETAFLDPDRVEVARGPQGALFGKSTIAGAVSVLSARPTAEFESYVRGGYEFEDGGYIGSAMVSGPLSETVRGRLAAEYKDFDGWMSNPFGVDDEPQTESYAARASLEWDASENTLIYLKLEHFDKQIDGNTNQLVSPGLFGGLTADPAPEYRRDTTRRVSTGTGQEDFDESDATSITLQVDHDIGEHTLTVIANHWELEYENYLDVDGVPENFLNSTLSEQYDQQSLEARLLSPTGNTLEYIVGALYHRSDTKTRQHSPFGFFPAFLAPVPVGGDRNFERDSDTISVYGQLTWNVSDRLRVIVDARYTEEEQDGKGFSFPVSYPDLINPVYTPTAFAQPPEYLFFQKYEDEHFDPSIRIQYDWTDEVMVYAAVSTGSKPGGLKANDGTLGLQLLQKADPAYYQRYVGQSTVTAADLIAGVTLEQGNGVFDFEDEEAENYEIGAKAVLAGGRATLNLALFKMKFDNLQTSSYDGTRFIIQNAASADVEGFELEGTWQASDSLRLRASVGHVDAVYDEFLGAQCKIADVDGTREDPTCVDGSEDLSGERLERTPKWETNLGADWQARLSDSLWLLTNVSMYYSGDYYARQDFHPYGRQSSFTKWDAR
ncbi:MAG: TonB-dependent receptor, partial [Pseudomonadales bacterium]